MGGVALGVAALIVVLSVMNGFQRELRSRILGVASHIEISGANGALSQWPTVVREAAQHPAITAAAPYIFAQGMLGAGQNVQGALIRGVEPRYEQKLTDFAKRTRHGDFFHLQAGQFQIALGSELARNLGVRVGDKVTLIAPQGEATPAGFLPRLKQFTVAAIFEIGMYEYDNGLALIHLADAQKLYRFAPNQVSGVRLQVAKVDDAPQIAEALRFLIRSEAYITDWTRQHANFFRAVQMEKRVMFVILLLIVAVAAFNIVSTLVMAVTDKQADIAILRTLGASPRRIMAIFMVQGTLIGVVGTLLGVSGGCLLAAHIDVVVPFIERLLGMKFLAKEVYYISELPSELQWADVVRITLLSLLLSVLATLYPSYRAAKTQPAEALRYE